MGADQCSAYYSFPPSGLGVSSSGGVGGGPLTLPWGTLRGDPSTTRWPCQTSQRPSYIALGHSPGRSEHHPLAMPDVPKTLLHCPGALAYACGIKQLAPWCETIEVDLGLRLAGLRVRDQAARAMVRDHRGRPRSSLGGPTRAGSSHVATCRRWRRGTEALRLGGVIAFIFATWPLAVGGVVERRHSGSAGSSRSSSPRGHLPSVPLSMAHPIDPIVPRAGPVGRGDGGRRRYRWRTRSTPSFRELGPWAAAMAAGAAIDGAPVGCLGSVVNCLAAL